jgi:hypothetical protein
VASNYPGSLDSFDTIASDKKTSDAVGGRTHRQMHNDLGDAIEAVQGELGTTPSGSDATVAARLTAIEAGTNLATGAVTSAKIADGTIATGDIADGAVTSAKIADGTIVNDDINASAAIARSKISGLPTSSTDNTVARFDSTAGAIQTSGVVIDDNNRLTVATGATGGYGFASGAVHLSGTGSPEGVVTAAPGSTWLQTDATTDVKGWIRWIKATGTGNTGWVAGPEADTGWRDVSASLNAAWALDTVAGLLHIARVGYRVTLRGRLKRVTASGSRAAYSPLLALPTGFAAVSHTAKGAASCLSGVAIMCTHSLPSEIGVARYTGVGTWAADDTLDFEVSWITTAAWLSSLPGSAA